MFDFTEEERFVCVLAVCACCVFYLCARATRWRCRVVGPGDRQVVAAALPPQALDVKRRLPT